MSEIKINSNDTLEIKLSKIDDWLAQQHQANKFNGAVLYLKNNEPLLINTHGYTNYLQNEALTNQSAFRLASLSKQFTATGIMLLNEQEKLKYNDLITQYIPNFLYKNVSIRNLLNQTSGIPDNYMQLAEKHKSEIKILTNKKAVELIIEAKQALEQAPNKAFNYSNSNYTILAYLIEVISGESFESFMQKELFGKLEMKNTRVWNLLSTDKVFLNKTDGFSIVKQGEAKAIKPTFLDGVAGDGAVFSSIEDFIIWNKFWKGNKLISNQNLEEVFKQPMLNNGAKSNYGFGWIINETGAFHMGEWLGANTAIIRNTEKNSCFVLLDNSDNIFFNKIIEAISRAFK